MPGYNYADLAALNAARRHHHHHHNRDPEHASPAEHRGKTMLLRGGPFILKKFAGTVTAGLIGFTDTYWGMPALGADKDGKGGLGLDTAWAIVTNIIDLIGAFRAAGPVGGRWVGGGISGTADSSWYMWVGKQFQLYGASKKGGAEAEVGAAIDYSQRDDARGGTSNLGVGAPRPHAEQQFVVDPLAGFR